MKDILKNGTEHQLSLYVYMERKRVVRVLFFSKNDDSGERTSNRVYVCDRIIYVCWRGLGQFSSSRLRDHYDSQGTPLDVRSSSTTSNNTRREGEQMRYRRDSYCLSHFSPLSVTHTHSTCLQLTHLQRVIGKCLEGSL